MAPKSDGKYPDRLGKSEFIDVIDLTPSIQKVVDWDKVAASGVKGVIIQSSRYSSTPELAYDKYAEDASKAGLAVGAYHFCACDSDPVEQAKFFVRRMKVYGLRPGDIPPMMDLEFAKETLGKKGPDYVVNWGVRFILTLQAEMKKLHLEKEPMWYSFPNFMASLEPYLSKSMLAQCQFSLARYRANSAPRAAWYPPDGWRPDLLPKAFTRLVMCQYSGKAGYWVPGIDQDCDRNVFFGSQGDWAEFRGLDRPVHQTEYPLHEP